MGKRTGRRRGRPAGDAPVKCWPWWIQRDKELRERFYGVGMFAAIEFTQSIKLRAKLVATQSVRTEEININGIF